MPITRDMELFGREDQPFTLHYYVGRDGLPMVSVTLLNGNHSKAIQLNSEQLKLLHSVRDAILFQTLGSDGAVGGWSKSE